MTRSDTMRSMTKRDFLRCSFAGLAGCIFASEGWELLAGMHRYIPAGSSAPAQKGIKEALFYTRTAQGIQCLKCPRFCRLAEGESGICRSRVAREGKLFSIAYGNPCALHIDPIEKKPLYHFLPSTRAFSIAAAGCNLRCLNCQNWQISQFSPEETQNMDLPPEKVVAECAAAGSESIAYTYSEPTTFYEYALDTAMLARKKKIRNVLKSNGYINEEPLRRLAKFLDAANIDLKCHDDAVYQKLSGAHLAPVLKTLRVLREEGVWLEITNLVIPSWSDDMGTIARMCAWLVANDLRDCPLHFTRFTPLYKLVRLPVTPVETLERAREAARRAGMNYVYIGNVPGHAAESTFCARCGRMVIERKGYRIAQFNLKKGRCAACGEAIPGVWGG